MNAYAARVSGAAMSGLLAQALQGRGGVIDWGELSLVEEKATARSASPSSPAGLLKGE
jgi:hypothetical protein